MYYWLVILIPTVLSANYDDWDKNICPPNRETFPASVNDYISLSNWLEGSGFSSQPIFGMDSFTNYRLLTKYPNNFPIATYQIQNITIKGVINPPLKKNPDMPFSKIRPQVAYPNLDCSQSQPYGLNLMKRCGKCYHIDECLFWAMYNCSVRGDDLKCKRTTKAPETHLKYYSTMQYYCFKGRLALSPVGNNEKVFATVIDKRSRYTPIFFKTKNCLGTKLEPVSYGYSSYFIPNTPKHFIFTFQCKCDNHCLMYFYATVYVVLADDVIVYDKYGYTRHPIESYVAQLDAKAEKFPSDAYGFLYNDDNTTFANNHWRSYTFRSKLKVVTYGYPGRYTSPYIYCVDYIPSDAVLPCETSNQSNYVFTTQHGKFAYQDEKVYTDPIFITPQLTIHPTLNSHQTPDGWLFNGSFAPGKFLNPDALPDLTDYQSNDYCFTDSFTPAVKLITVPRIQPIESLSCQNLCRGQSSTSSQTLCTTAELSSPLMQQCYSIVAQIRKLSGSKFKGNEFIPTSQIVNRTTFRTIKDFDPKLFVSNIKIQTFKTHNQISDRLRIFQHMFDVSDPSYGQYAVPVGDSWSNILGVFKEGMYNQDRDMSYMAAFPWLTAWRFGRQINALSYSISTLMQAYDGLVADLNTNLMVLQNAIKQSADQVVLNSRYINQLADTLSVFSHNTHQNLVALNLHLSTVEYMSAKLSQFSIVLASLENALLDYKIQLQLLNQRTENCNRGVESCMPFPGIYLAHQRLDTPSHHILLLSYMKPNCEPSQIDMYYCQDNVTYVAPYGCQFINRELEVIAPNATCDTPIKLLGCTYNQTSLFMMSFVTRPFTKLTPQEVPLHIVNYTDQLKPIDVEIFQANITTTLHEIKQIQTLSEFVNNTDQAWLDNVPEYGTPGWSIWDYLKLAGIILAVIIILPIIIGFLSLCLSCLKLIKKVA
ncbi:putative glycoprotein [Xinzhou toro-like virus]|uniref:Putative glycoprotein n=1 Tax=Xinzhou toro-like virus TaxID=1923777 RepID=A0A1L3KJ06_9NIDO|nr:putative glycoprotein [Xinzhou toro-like virus]APG77354.1 putative glycoprotein [Xinzhou toro-like virus]